MNEAGFRTWLESNYSPNTVQTKLSEARQLAKAYGDLDGHYDDDQLDAVMESLRYSAADKAQNRPNPSKVPLASDLYRDLSNLRTTVNYYRRYRGDKARPKPDKNAVNKAIDECAAVGLDAFLDTYGFGKDIDYWVVRDGTRYPSKAVFGVSHQFMPGGAPVDGKNCNGTEARLHLEKLGFEIVKGPADTASGSPITLFDAEGAAYVPERQQNQKTGVVAYWVKPRGAKSNKAEEMLPVETDLDIVKAILEGRLPARIKPVAGGPANLMKYGADKLIRYRLRPDIAAAMGQHTSDLQGNIQMESRQLATNVILYGPPGTGKTYTTAGEAVRLCDGLGAEDPLLREPSRREELRRRYDQLVESGQVRLVTFHQNYSYEEFVEGLRPVTDSGAEEDGRLQSAGFRLEPKRGIFREICTVAENARKNAGRSGGFDLAGRKLFKMSLGRMGVEDHIFDAAIEGHYVVLGWGGDVDWSDQRYDEWSAILERWQQESPAATGNDPNVVQMWPFRSAMKAGDLVVVSAGNSHFRAIGEVTGPYRFDPTETREYNHRRPVRWLLVPDEPLPAEMIYGKKFMMQSCYQLKDGLVNKDALSRLLPGGDAGSDDRADQFVLIIDEINRANISKVFGELITLIEPDKRLGAGLEALTVRLPYSGEAFGVPANLHIVGTMNTADRSIALLDTALRRRFIFREIEPNLSLLPEDVEGVPLRKVLETINDRIEYLIDREHRIGHAFFLGDGGRDRRAIDRTMRDKVIPLLQEYFFEDWSRVAAVLGERPGKGGSFLICRKLKDPTGQGGEERESWSVLELKKFASDAYERLIGTPAVTSLDEGPDSSLDEAAE